MKKFLILFLMLLMIALPGCGLEGDERSNSRMDFQEVVYSSDTPEKDCYLCADSVEKLIPEYWGQNNVALISLNTFQVKPIEINRYDRLSRQMIEEYAGTVSFGGGGSIDGGFSANLLLEYDRGYATGSMDFLSDETLDIDKAASFLCADCLNEILPMDISQCFGVGVINLDTKEIRLFENSLGGFGLGDFYIDYDLMEQETGDSQRMNLLIFHCPSRYEPEH